MHTSGPATSRSSRRLIRRILGQRPPLAIDLNGPNSLGSSAEDGAGIERPKRRAQ
jgi:hypothetical protein